MGVNYVDLKHFVSCSIRCKTVGSTAQIRSEQRQLPYQAHADERGANVSR